MALAGLIAGALRGDPRSVMALETMGTDVGAVQEAMGLLAQRVEQPAVGHFAAQIVLRHARTGEGADLGALCTECLQVTLAAPSLPGHRQLLSAAAAAATRAGPDATLQVHAEAMRLARAAQLGAGADDGGASALAALQLVHAMAEESGGAAVQEAVREALVAQGAEVFRLITAVLCGSAGERGIAGGLECLTEWARTLGVGMDAVLATEGLLSSLCTLTQSTDESVLDSLADCLEVLLTRPFGGHSAAVRRAAKANTRPEDEPWRTNGPALEQLGVAVASQRARFSDEQVRSNRRLRSPTPFTQLRSRLWRTVYARSAWLVSNGCSGSGSSHLVVRGRRSGQPAAARVPRCWLAVPRPTVRCNMYRGHRPTDLRSSVHRVSRASPDARPSSTCTHPTPR